VFFKTEVRNKLEWNTTKFRVWSICSNCSNIFFWFWFNSWLDLLNFWDWRKRLLNLTLTWFSFNF